MLELDIRDRYDINIVAIKRGNNVIVSPLASEMIRKGDILLSSARMKILTALKRKL
ncbi:K+/H+ antiporter YhaU regulatory subunit KhtT [Anoxybacillus caldiproteolyticus]|uniref:K+/H+ antiporter YhaU regulatory subunit KhtT n=1 Tax=Thermaerobacillus caldiproteolyticus TaxID=247480 RepID=A0A7V9Z513_9BACL|nr:K+/H+ antiporter YhaU regulatory subunit KhtT [Anoxybacillus caldiproteolyticus]